MVFPWSTNYNSFINPLAESVTVKAEVDLGKTEKFFEMAASVPGTAYFDQLVSDDPTKVQVIRTKGQKERLCVGIPGAIAAAISMEGGEEVEWDLLDPGELHLVRKNVPEPAGTVKKASGKK